MATMQEDEDRLNTEATQPASLERWRDFRIVLLGGAALLLIVGLGDWLKFLQPVRLILGCVYILFAPGYCLMVVLFPHEEDLDGVEHIGLSLGLSIAWVPVLALILNALPWGLRMWPVVFGELVSITMFILLALLRRSQLQANKAYVPELAWQPRRWWRSLPGSDRNAYWFIGVALVLITLTLSWTFLAPTPDKFMTEFYMLGPEGLAEGFPREVATGEEIGVTLAVVNLEQDAHTYRVEVWAVDPWTEGRLQMVAHVPPFELARGGNRQWPVSWQMPWPGKDQEVELLLFDGNETSPYRRLRLWLDVKP